jgi:uncharacterized membrane protein
MDNLFGFCFCFAFLYRYAREVLVHLIRVFVLEQKIADGFMVLLCNSAMAGFIGVLLISEGFLEEFAALVPQLLLHVLAYSLTRKYCPW